MMCAAIYGEKNAFSFCGIGGGKNDFIGTNKKIECFSLIAYTKKDAVC